MSVETLLRVANHSGGVLYVIAVLLFVSLTVIIERLWFLQRVARATHAALAELDQRKVLNAGALAAWAGQHGGHDGLPTGRVIAMASQLARHVERVERDALAASLEEAVMREAPRIDRFLWVLDTAVTLAPLLGLFGTIVGMFDAFQGLSNPVGSASAQMSTQAPAQVSGGVAEALIATAAGLFVAMIGLVCFNGLHSRVRIVVHQLDTLRIALVNRLTSGVSADVPAVQKTGIRAEILEAEAEAGAARGSAGAFARQGV